MTDENEKYRKIIDLSRPASKKRFPVGAADRAAQFAPFAALNGYDEEICETARIVESSFERGKKSGNASNKRK